MDTLDYWYDRTSRWWRPVLGQPAGRSGCALLQAYSVNYDLSAVSLSVQSLGQPDSGECRYNVLHIKCEFIEINLEKIFRSSLFSTVFETNSLLKCDSYV